MNVSAKAKAKPAAAEVVSYSNALLEVMDGALGGNPNVLILGQGADDFKGIFGSTTGLAKKYGGGRGKDKPPVGEGMTGGGRGRSRHRVFPVPFPIPSPLLLLLAQQN